MINKVKNILKSKDVFNYIATFGAEFIIMTIGVLMFKLISLKFEDIGFSEYNINKRLIGFLIPLLMVGMGVSLPKFLPTFNKKKQLEVYYTALITISSAFIIILIFNHLFNDTFSKLIYGDKKHNTMLFTVLIHVFSLLIHSIVYNYFRSKFKFKIASSIQLLNLGILPLSVYFFSNNISDFFLYQGITCLIILLVISVVLIPFVKLNRSSFYVNFKLLIKYGVQRIPGDVTLGLFFAIPAFIAANYFSIILAGNIAFCFSLFNIVIALMSPVNTILLPKASKIIHKKDFSLLKSISNNLIKISIFIGAVCLIVIAFFGKNILNLFDITNNAEIFNYLFVIFTAIIAYSVFSVIRSIIDAYYHTARVSFIIIIGFIFFIFSIVISHWLNLFSILNLLIIFSISINIIGILIYISLLRIFKQQVNKQLVKN